MQMGQRGRSRARCDPDLDDNGSPSRRLIPLSEDEEAAGGHPGVADLLSLSCDEGVSKDAVADLKRKKKRRKERRKKQRNDDRKDVAAVQEEPQVAGTQEGEIGIAESVLTEDGADVPVPDNTVPRNHLLMKKNHLRELFVSKNERIICDSLEAFVLKHLQGTSRTLEVEVPGSKTNETYLVPAVICRLCTKELARVFVIIFQARWSFSGDLDCKDLFVTPLGCVKISLEKMKDLVPADAEKIKKDAATVTLIVRNSIFDHAPLALDITSFVTVLEDFNGNCKTLMHHPGLKEEVGKLCQFKVLYMRSVRIFQLDKVKHTRIIEKLPYCQVNKQHWKMKMETNICFERILKHGKRTIWQSTEPVAANQGHLLKEQILPANEAPPSKLERLTTSEEKERKSQGQDVKALFQMLLVVIAVNYDDDGLALSRNVRNPQLHGFMDHSVQPARAGRKQSPEPATMRFNYAQIEHMIGCTLPNFFCQFYLAMADEDEIDSPEENAMSELCLGGSM